MRTGLAAFTSAASLLLFVGLPDAGAARGKDDAIVKLIAASKEIVDASGKPMIAIQVAIVPGNQVIVLEAHHKAPERGSDRDKDTKPEIDPKIKDVIVAAKPGDLLDVQWQGKRITAIKEFKGSPWEAEPDVYTFVKQTETDQKGTPWPGISVKKLKDSNDFLVPPFRGKDGKQIPDPNLKDYYDTFHANQLVELHTQGQFVASIVAWEPPRTVEFKEVATEPLDGADYPAIKVNEEGKEATLTVLLPRQKSVGKTPSSQPDKGILEQFKRMKAGTRLVIQVRPEEKLFWLVKFAPAPKAATPAKGGR